MKKRYLNALILAILILAPLAYTIAPTKSKTTVNVSTYETEEEYSANIEVSPQASSVDTVYYIPWDEYIDGAIVAGEITKGYALNNEIYVVTEKTLQRITGSTWVRALKGTVKAVHDSYIYVYDSAETKLYIYDASTGAILYEIPLAMEYDDYRIGDFIPNNGIMELVVWDEGTGEVSIFTETGIKITGFTGRIAVEGLGDDIITKYDGWEIITYFEKDIGGGKYNIIIHVYSLENMTELSEVKSVTLLSKIDDFHGAMLLDINKDGIDELLVAYTNNTYTYYEIYNTTEGVFDRLTQIKFKTAYNYEGGEFLEGIWVNNNPIVVWYNSSHVCIANVTSGDYKILKIAEKYRENTHIIKYAPVYVNETLGVAMFANKTPTASYDADLLKLYVFNATDGSEIWNLTLKEAGFFLDGSWIVLSTGSDVYIINARGAYFIVDTITGEFTEEYLPTRDYDDYTIVHIPGTDYYVGYDYGYYQLISVNTEGAITVGYVDEPVRGIGETPWWVPYVLPAFDIDGDGVPEGVLSTRTRDYYYYNYYWFDLAELTLDERIGPKGFADNYSIYNILDVKADEKLMLMNARNYTENVKINVFGWFNWSSGEWIKTVKYVTIGDGIKLEDDIWVIILYNTTEDTMYLAKINTTTLEYIEKVNISGIYKNSKSWDIKILYTDFNGDGENEIMLIPYDTDDKKIVVTNVDLSLLYLYELDTGHIKYYGTLDVNGDGILDYYFVTESEVYFFGLNFEFYGKESISDDIENVFELTIPGYGDCLLLALSTYVFPYGDVNYFTIIGYVDVQEYDEILKGVITLGGTIDPFTGLPDTYAYGEIITAWTDGEALVVIDEYLFAYTYDISDYPFEIWYVGDVNILWPLHVDLYPAIFNWWENAEEYYTVTYDVVYAEYMGDVPLFILGGDYTTEDRELDIAGFIVVDYMPDIEAPEVVTIQNVYVAGEVIEFEYGASDDLLLAYIYIDAYYTLADGRVVYVPIAEQPAYRFGNSYHSTAIVTLPPDLRDMIVEAEIYVMAIDWVYVYYDALEHYPGITFHYGLDFAVFDIDLTAPELFVAYPVNGSSFTLSKTDEIALSVRVTEDSFAYGYTVDVLINVNNKYAFYVTTEGDFVVTIPAEALVEGTNTIIIRATDVAGNTATITIVINVTFKEPAEEAASAAAEASLNSMIAGIIAVLVALLALGIAAIRRS